MVRGYCSVPSSIMLPLPRCLSIGGRLESIADRTLETLLSIDESDAAWNLHTPPDDSLHSVAR